MEQKELKTWVCAIAPACRIILGVVKAEDPQQALEVAEKEYPGLFLGIRAESQKEKTERLKLN